MTGTSLKYTTSDVETLGDLQATGARVSHRQRYDYAVAGLTGTLRELGLMGRHAWEKFIPHDYLWNDVEARVAILQGLMDTDGNIEAGSGKMEYSTTSDQLAKDVLFLVQSLGGKGTISSRQTTYTHNGEKRVGRVSYRIRFRVPNICPFRIRRKAERWKVKGFTGERILRHIEDVGQQETTCIAVDHPSRLYVARDFIVTHNSFCAAVKLLHHAFYQTRDAKYAHMKDHYIAINLSITVEQARIVWSTAYNIAKRSKQFRRFVLDDETRNNPFPMMVIGWGQNDEKVRSIIWARSCAKDATYLLGMDFDFVNWDEAARAPDGKRILDDVIRMRLVDRDGRLDCTSTGDGRNWYYGEFMKALEAVRQNTKPTIYARTGPTFENPHISNVRVKANMAHMTKEMVEQNVYGGFSGGDGIFNRDRLKECYKGCDWRVWKTPGEIRFRKGASYGAGVDFGWNDETVVMVYEDHPAGYDSEEEGERGRTDWSLRNSGDYDIIYGPRIVYVQSWQREDWQVVWDTLAAISERLHHPYFVIDSTSQAGNIHTEMLTQRGMNIFPYAFSGSRAQKEHLITLGQQYVEQALIRWPFLPELYDQLAMYDRDDRKLTTDWAFSYMLMCECHHRQLAPLEPAILLTVPTTPMTLSRSFGANRSAAGSHTWNGPAEYWPTRSLPEKMGGG